MVGTNPIIRFCFRNVCETFFISEMEETLCSVSWLDLILVSIIDLLEFPLF